MDSGGKHNGLRSCINVSSYVWCVVGFTMVDHTNYTCQYCFQHGAIVHYYLILEKQNWITDKNKMHSMYLIPATLSSSHANRDSTQTNSSICAPYDPFPSISQLILHIISHPFIIPIAKSSSNSSNPQVLVARLFAETSAEEPWRRPRRAPSPWASPWAPLSRAQVPGDRQLMDQRLVA